MDQQLVRSNIPGYSVDKTTGAVINTNEGQLLLAQAERRRSKEVRQLQQDIDSLNKDIIELKDLVHTILKDIKP